MRLPSWPCEFDSRHPLHSESPGQWNDRSANAPLAVKSGGHGPLIGPLAVTAASDPLINRIRNLSIPLAGGVRGQTVAGLIFALLPVVSRYAQEALFDRQRTDTKTTIAAERLAVIAAITLAITSLSSVMP
jgi:hypothetical protein